MEDIMNHGRHPAVFFETSQQLHLRPLCLLPLLRRDTENDISVSVFSVLCKGTKFNRSRDLIANFYNLSSMVITCKLYHILLCIFLSGRISHLLAVMLFLRCVSVNSVLEKILASGT